VLPNEEEQRIGLLLQEASGQSDIFSNAAKQSASRFVICGNESKTAVEFE